MGMKLTMRFRAHGFPSGISASSVTSLLKQIGWHVVPIRVFHIAELAIAILACDKPPPTNTIPTNNGALFVEQIPKRAPKPHQKKQEAGVPTLAAKSLPHQRASASTSQPATHVRTQPLTTPPANQSFMSPFAASLGSRVAALEEKVGHISTDLQTVKEIQHQTTTELTSIKQSQESGFSNLMAAIADLRNQSPVAAAAAPASVFSSPAVRSPAPKIPKLGGS
eukprot:s1893_g5.t1